MARNEFADDLAAAVILNVLYLAVAAVVLLPLGRGPLLLDVVAGFVTFWGALVAGSMLLTVVLTLLHVNEDTHFDGYLLSHTALTVVLLAGWSAFLALGVNASVDGAPVWKAALVHVIGFLGAHTGYSVVSMWYQGSFYKRIDLPVALATYVLFAAWPPAARATFGWFFGLF